MTDTEQRLEIFAEFLDCSDIAFWHFDSSMHLISTDSTQHPVSQQLLILFHIGGCQEAILSYCKRNRLPGFYSDIASMVWLAAPKYHQDTLTDIYIVGPVFISSSSERALSASLQSLHASGELLGSTRMLLRAIPVVPHTFLMQYGVMLHRCLTGVKLESADIQIISSGNTAPKIPQKQETEETEPVIHVGTYAMEQQIFQAVEEGNVEFVHPKQVYQRHTRMLHKTDPLRSAKNEIITCITLITRAAIRGGLPEDSAYALSDYYILLLEDASSVAEVYQYSRDAFRDFTERVRKYRLRACHSKEILDCISYLELHFDRRVSMDELSAALGYNKNYLSTKFTREVGISISEYLLRLRVERAKILLQNTDRSMQEICGDLGFGSASYFSAQFRRFTGLSPRDFRNRREHDM